MTGSSKFLLCPFLGNWYWITGLRKLDQVFNYFLFWKASIVKDTHTLDMISKWWILGKTKRLPEPIAILRALAHKEMSTGISTCTLFGVVLRWTWTEPVFPKAYCAVETTHPLIRTTGTITGIFWMGSIYHLQIKHHIYQMTKCSQKQWIASLTP